MTGEFSLAIHALVFLSRHPGATQSSETLADNICTNPARVRKVMSGLKKAGLVSTKEGAEGGYALERPSGEITLRQVADAVDARFVSASWRSGDIDRECLIASGMAGVMDGLYGELDGLCKARLAALTVADIEGRIFPPG